MEAFSYSAGDGSAQISIKGDPAARYKLVAADDLDFSNPSQDPLVLAAASVGTLFDNDVFLDATGNATVQFNLGNVKTANFFRAELVPELLVLQATAGSYVVDGANAGNNFGATQDLRTLNKGSEHRELLLRFDLPAGTEPPDSAFILIQTTGGETNPVQNAAYLTDGTSWTELGVTWNNRPLAGAELDAWVTSNGRTIKIDVTDAVASALPTGGSFEVIIKSPHNVGSDGLSVYASREHPVLAGPRLELYFNEPSITVQPGESVQDALDAMNAVGGGRVQLAAGDHVVSQSLEIYSNITLAGEGAGVSQLKLHPAVNRPILIGTSEGSVNRDITIRDLTLDGQQADGERSYPPSTHNNRGSVRGYSFGILFADTDTGNSFKNIRIQDVTITRCAVGVHIKGVDDLRIRNSDIRDNGCIIAFDHNIYFRRANNTLLKNLDISDCTAGNGFNLSTNCNNVILDGCDASGNTFRGMRFFAGDGGSRMMIINCIASRNGLTQAGTSTIGVDTLVTAANVNVGTLNFNSTQSSGTLTLPTGSTGTVVVGAGAQFATVDLSAGAGTVTAENPLTITSGMLLSDSFSVTTDGAAFTVQTAAGENLASNAATRTFTASGGRMTLAVEGAPAVTGISYTQVTNDADSGITSEKTFTHALDWGSSGAATVNGVAFATDMNQSVGGRSNSGTRTYGSSGTHAGNDPPAVSGNVASVFRDMVYGGPDPGHIELTGLTAGEWYDVKLYERAWDYDNAIRTYYNLFDVGADGIVEYTTPKLDQNRATLTPPGMSGNVSWVTSYVYQADNSGKMRVPIDLADDQTGSYHLYGLTNEVVPPGSGILNFPNTHLAAKSTSEISLGSPTSDQLIGDLSILGSGTAVTLSDAQSVSLNNIAASATGSIAAGVPISLRDGGVTVPAGEVLTVHAPLVDSASPTSVTKLEGGTLTLGGSNTHTGNTTISDGSLVLAEAGSLTFAVTDTGSNKVAGPGSATFNGGFTIDTSAVTVTSGNWTLVDVSSKSFALTFTIDGAGWSETDDVWTLVDGANTWQFSESTGTLTLNEGLPPADDYDTWNAEYPDADLSDRTADYDGDGMSNFQEYAFGLDPTSGASVNPITDISDLKTLGEFTYTRRSGSGLNFSIWTSTTLQAWTEEVLADQEGAQPVDGVESVLVILPDTPTDDKLFIRVKAE